jgi:T5SS/PEP-CTERM-associated repeat protein
MGSSGTGTITVTGAGSNFTNTGTVVSGTAGSASLMAPA